MNDPLRQAQPLMQPLALIFYENLLPGSQLVNRLQDLGYRVLAHMQASTLVDQAKQARPFLMIVDLASQRSSLCDIIRKLKQTPETAHIPVLAFAKDGQEQLRASAHAAGAALVAGEVAILSHLPQLLEQLLEMEP